MFNSTSSQDSSGPPVISSAHLVLLGLDGTNGQLARVVLPTGQRAGWLDLLWVRVSVGMKKWTHNKKKLTHSKKKQTHNKKKQTHNSKIFEPFP